MSSVKKIDFRQKLNERAREHAESVFADPEYIVRQIHKDGETVELWRCGRPGSSIFMFYVCSAPNCLMVYGDMGDFMWHREYKMIPWARGSVHSLDYFSEKVPRDIKIKCDYGELVDEWLAGLKEEWIESGGEWTSEMEYQLNSLQASWVMCEPDCHAFKLDVYDSEFYNDCDDMPETQYYTYHYLWVVEGLKWFLKKLDAGEVEKSEVTA